MLDADSRPVSEQVGDASENASKQPGGTRRRAVDGVMGEVADRYCLSHGRHGDGDADADSDDDGGRVGAHPVNPGGPPATP